MATSKGRRNAGPGERAAAAAVAGSKEAATAELPARPVLLAALRESYEGPAWHGPSVRAALRGVTAEDASWRPAPGRNTIWELTLHLAYTRHRLLSRLGALGDGAPRRFPRKLRTSWWPRPPDALTEEAWREDRALLEQYQRWLIEAVRTVPRKTLEARQSRTQPVPARQLLGVAFHDVYHAGQIRFIVRLRSAGPDTEG